MSSILDTLKPSHAQPLQTGLVRRTHTMGDVDRTSTPTEQREAILAALRENEPRDRTYFREALGISGADLEIALTRLRDKGLIYGIQGEGYRLGRRPLPAIPGTPVIEPSKETSMPKGHYDRSKSKRKARAAKPADIAIAPAEPTDKKPRKRRARAQDEHAAAPARKTSGEASFLVDDAGRMTVIGTDGARVELTLPDTKRLANFIKLHGGK
jgi:hypothetical protein